METFATFVYTNFASTASMSFRLTSSEVLPPGVFLCVSPFLQKGGMLFGSSRDAIRASRGFSSPSARLVPAGGVEEPLVARSVHASLLLSPRFLRGLGMWELLSCGKLLMLFMSDWLSFLISVRSTR